MSLCLEILVIRCVVVVVPISVLIPAVFECAVSGARFSWLIILACFLVVLLISASTLSGTSIWDSACTLSGTCGSCSVFAKLTTVVISRYCVEWNTTKWNPEGSMIAFVWCLLKPNIKQVNRVIYLVIDHGARVWRDVRNTVSLYQLWFILLLILLINTVIV